MMTSWIGARVTELQASLLDDICGNLATIPANSGPMVRKRGYHMNFGNELKMNDMDWNSAGQLSALEHYHTTFIRR
jgi:hypothetical protein